ncbi:MAG: hypothetical protein MRK02_18095 [Candidatus Scalindua sp.]|nr:hypothetical protein [Candidatus Scalindua sp.]
MKANNHLNITLVINSLACGGTERVMPIMVNYWAKKDWGITVITLDSMTSDFF